MFNSIDLTCRRKGRSPRDPKPAIIRFSGEYRFPRLSIVVAYFVAIRFRRDNLIRKAATRRWIFVQHKFWCCPMCRQNVSNFLRVLFRYCGYFDSHEKGSTEAPIIRPCSERAFTLCANKLHSRLQLIFVPKASSNVFISTLFFFLLLFLTHTHPRTHAHSFTKQTLPFYLSGATVLLLF